MARIVERSLGKRGRAATDLRSRQIITLQGKRVKARLVDAESKSLGDDLLEAFGRSVDRTRRVNKELFGNRDHVDDGQG